ncbi:diacylglycerol kinase [Afipia massiliensis]|uniref:Diacylglycerol kinase n=1 Tax=Afipia massiliensis TaxID=211460 RepID=A0A4U6BWL0_9BRAD|nr:diacylglycerol kinase [Afipia massiliensis]TKT73598.1 diacylglycerol kinase [Afipia massiliensis]
MVRVVLSRMCRATINSRNGLAFAFRSEQAFREELIALLLAIPLAWLIGVTPARRLELVMVVLLLMVVELLNTAIEKLADRLTTDHDPQIGRVKDMGSAAVAVMLLIAGIFWLFAIAERIGLI